MTVESEQKNEQRRPMVNIVGEMVALGPFDKELADEYYRWMNDLDTQRLAGYMPEPRSRESVLEYFEGWSKAKDDAFFLIYEVSTWRPIGFTGLMHIRRHTRSAEFGITIGEPDTRGKGYGTETARLVLDYAFTAMGLNSVNLSTASFNIAGQHAYKKAGFREVGRLREAEFMGGKFYDLIYMDCLASEFKSPVLGPIFAPSQERS